VDDLCFHGWPGHLNQQQMARPPQGHEHEQTRAEEKKIARQGEDAGYFSPSGHVALTVAYSEVTDRKDGKKDEDNAREQ
jgi:hypothetical protein